MGRPKKKIMVTTSTNTAVATVPRRKRLHKKYIPIGFPSSTTCRLRYVDAISIDVASTVGTYAFRANGLYDPNQTSVGHQPSFFDTYAAIYDHYVVTESSCRATFHPESTSAASYGVVVGIKLDDDNSVTPAGQQVALLESPDKLFHWKMTRSGVLYGDQIVKVKHHYDPLKFFGIKDIKDNQDTLGAATSTNPTEEAYFLVCVGTPMDGVDIPAMQVLVEIEYTVQFSELRDQGLN